MTSDPDEITTDVDPSWVASIRAGERPPESDPGREAEPTVEPRSTGGDWTEVEPAWDPEATVGVSDGLLERIRQEIGTQAPPPPPSPDPPPPSSAAPPVPASSTPAPPQNSAPPISAPPPISTPKPAPAAPSIPAMTTPEPRAEQLASTTVRWEPRQRLTATAPVNETSVIAPPTTRGTDRTKVAIAAIAAIAVVVVAWLFIGSRSGDDAPPPIDSVPTSEGASVAGSTIPADPDDGAGG